MWKELKGTGETEESDKEEKLREKRAKERGIQTKQVWMQKTLDMNADFKLLLTVHLGPQFKSQSLKTAILHGSSSTFIIKTQTSCLMGLPRKPTRTEINLCAKAGVTRGM